MDTERLIRALAEDLEPVTPLRTPWRRSILWTAGGIVYVLLLALVMSPREDLVARIHQPGFVIEQAAALLLAVAAAAAAFAAVVPGQRRTVFWLPLLPAAIWIGVISIGALREMQLSAAEDVVVQASWGCVWTVLAAAALPAIIMAAMLRQGVPMAPRVAAAYGGLAAAGLGNLGICFFHADSSNLVVLLWHCGTVLAVAAFAALAARQLLPWPANTRSISASRLSA